MVSREHNMMIWPCKISLHSTTSTTWTRIPGTTFSSVSPRVTNQTTVTLVCHPCREISFLIFYVVCPSAILLGQNILGYYLEKKNLHDYMGVDTYVKQCFEKDDLKWIPTRNSFALQNIGSAVASEENADEKIVKALRDVSVGLAHSGKRSGCSRSHECA